MNEIQKQVIEALRNPAVADKDAVCKNIDSMVNTFSFPAKDISAEIMNDSKAAELFLKLSLLWIRQLQKRSLDGNYDDRNAYSVEVCGKIGRRPEFEEVCQEYLQEYKDISKIVYCKGDFLKLDIPLEQMIVNYMGCTHRTLQQTFSSLVFSFLKECGCDKVRDMLQHMVNTGALYSNFERTPLI